MSESNDRRNSTTDQAAQRDGLSRREALSALGAGAAAVVAAGSAVGSEQPAPANLAEVTREDFASCRGSLFRLHAPAGTVLEVLLMEVTALAPPPPAAADVSLRTEPFSLLFRTSGDCDLPQGIYRLSHEKFPRLEMFLVPVGPDGQGMRYEAIVN